MIPIPFNAIKNVLFKNERGLAFANPHTYYLKNFA